MPLESICWTTTNSVSEKPEIGANLRSEITRSPQISYKTPNAVRRGSLTAAQSEFLGLTSRSSPQVDGDVIYLGTLAHALLVALNKHTGSVLDVI